MKKLIAILLSILVLLTAFVGCKGVTNDNTDSAGNQVTDKSKILDISVWNSGYGIKWVDAIKNAYMKDHPGVAINVTAHADSNDFVNTIGLDSASANATDLYFNYAPDYLKYTDKLVKFNDLLESKMTANETKTLAEKFGEDTLSALVDNNGDYYALTYGGGTSGIVYNEKLFKQFDLTREDGSLFIPRTTQELEDLTRLIRETTDYKGTGNDIRAKAPIMHYPGYWQSAAIVWWLQYSGTEEFSRFFRFEGLGGKELNDSMQSVYQQEGMKVGLEALYSIITKEGVTYKQSNDVSTGAFARKQYLFFMDEVALMYPCGSWLETEMEKTDGFDMSVFDNFSVMKYPVVSALVDKLSNPDVGEIGLCELIDYVDAIVAGKTDVEKPEWATNEDVEKVKFARNCTTGQTASSTVCIPSYSESIDLAKDFLKFMYSDEGLKIFAETQHYFRSVDFDSETVKNSIDTSTWSTYSKANYAISMDNINVPQNLNHPIRYRGGAREVFITAQPEKQFTLAEGAMTVEEFLDSEWKKIKDNWKGQYYQYVNN